jgi:DNA-directed RNA polymerase subunit RPC12/RpoP
MLDGRYQCLTCSKHITGMYQGKEHAPHQDNIYGQITMVECDQAGRIPICDKCTRPVTGEEDAFKHDTRYYHLDCARCNRCRKKLFNIPCRKLGSALGKLKNNKVFKII